MPSLVRVTVIRYLLRGKQVRKGTPGARKVRELSAAWYGKGVPGWPPARRKALSTDRPAALKMLADLCTAAERGRAGLPDAAAARVPLSDWLDRWAADLPLGLGSGGKWPGRKPGPKQVADLLNRVRTAFDGCRFRDVADLNLDAPRALAAYLHRRLGLPRTRGRLPRQTPNAERRRRKAAGRVTPAPDPHALALSHQSAGNYAAGCQRFVRWLNARRVPVPADLFDPVGGFDPASNRTHVRRECSPDELARVLDAALRDRTPRRKPDGPARYHLYLLAWSTGFRADELAGLTPGHFDLTATPPAVVLRAGEAKNRRRVAQPLPAAVAVQLATFLAGRPAGERVWPGRWWSNAAKMLRRDLAAAGVPYRADTPDGPAVLDFHALRHSFVSALAAAGVGPKELQELARHSDPRLTLGVYTHARRDRLAAAVENLVVPAPPAAG